MKVLTWSPQNNIAISDQIHNHLPVVIPTDTLYGVVASALSEEAVNLVYLIKGRTPEKPFIILISDRADLKKFDVKLTSFQKQIMSKLWPGQYTLILPCSNTQFGYLHRGTDSLAFRMPDDRQLGKLLEITGPLIAPSCNPEGQNPAETISEAQNYFAGKVPLFIDGGKRISKPSTIISLIGDQINVLRGQFQGRSRR